jgi:hypothetical protein
VYQSLHEWDHVCDATPGMFKLDPLPLSLATSNSSTDARHLDVSMGAESPAPAIPTRSLHAPRDSGVEEEGGTPRIVQHVHSLLIIVQLFTSFERSQTSWSLNNASAARLFQALTFRHPQRRWLLGLDLGTTSDFPRPVASLCCCRIWPGGCSHCCHQSTRHKF